MTEFMHLTLGDRRITVAFQVEEQRAKVALAFCCPKDQFIKRTGRLISEGRLNMGKVFCTVTLTSGDRIKEQVAERVQSEIGSNPSSPYWATT